MTELEQIKQIATQTCCGIVCDTCPLVKICDERSSKDVAKVALELLSYDSDLSKRRGGDWVWSVEDGWVQIKEIEYRHPFPIILKGGKRYTSDGKHYCTDCAPVVFSIPPLCFNPEPRPESVCRFKRGDKVLVSNRPDGEKNYRYFVEYKPNSELPYFCFANGGDEWSSKGKTMGWKYCEAAEEK